MQQSGAVQGAILIAQEKATPWEHGMALQAPAVVAILAAVTATAAREAVAARERREAEAAAREAAAAHEARAAQEAIAKREVELRAWEEALAQDMAQREAEERAHADAAKRDAFGTARRKVAGENSRTEAEIRALEAERGPAAAGA